MTAAHPITERPLPLPEVLAPSTVELTSQRLKKKFDTLRQDWDIQCYSTLYDYRKNRRAEWLCKRLFDVTFSLLCMLVLMPFFVLIALAIRLDSRGPVVFRQKRIGYRGKPFYMYKFRSMHMNAEDRLHRLLAQNETSVMFKIKADPRVTRVGKFLRKFSLDEFPQLLNVLRGEMSLVGPRPPIIRELSMYQPWHYVRFSVLPGMTGMWQVYGRSDIRNFDDVVCLDAKYIENWSLSTDLSLILKTVPTVLSAKGSY
jgi:exopolysaccharide biosynthesis polyprenyl glycosylphosphotransferase